VRVHESGTHPPSFPILRILNTLSVGYYVDMEGSPTSARQGQLSSHQRPEVNRPTAEAVLALRYGGMENDLRQRLSHQPAFGAREFVTRPPSPTSIPAATAEFSDPCGQGPSASQGCNDDDVGGARAIVRFHPNEELTSTPNTHADETSGWLSRYTPGRGSRRLPADPSRRLKGWRSCNTE